MIHWQAVNGENIDKLLENKIPTPLGKKNKKMWMKAIYNIQRYIAYGR